MNLSFNMALKVAMMILLRQSTSRLSVDWLSLPSRMRLPHASELTLVTKAIGVPVVPMAVAAVIRIRQMQIVVNQSITASKPYVLKMLLLTFPTRTHKLFCRQALVYSWRSKYTPHSVTND